MATKLAILSLAASAFAGKKHLMEARTGITQQCIGGRVHTVSYDTLGAESAAFVDMDSGDMGSKLSSVTCDIDHTRLSLKFHNSVEATEYFLKFHDWNDHFITGGAKWGCKTIVNQSTYVLRRIVGASQAAHLGDTIFVDTAMARYDEVFESANIAYTSEGACDVSDPKWSMAEGSVGLRSSEGDVIDKHICLGYNTDCSGVAKAPIPLYSSGKISVTCSDCWAALQTDVFVNMSIGSFKLERLTGGFKNAMLNASMVFDAAASAQWNVGLDKTMPLVANTYLIDFKVGPVPFMLSFEIPLEVTANLQFNSAADLTVGTNAGIDLGNAFISWDPTNHWTHANPTPVFDLKPAISTKLNADIDMTGNLGITPTFKMNFDRVFSYSLKASPSLTAEVTGTLASKQLCLTSNYALDVVANTNVDININIIDFHKDWTWGPTTVYSNNGVAVPKKCITL